MIKIYYCNTPCPDPPQKGSEQRMKKIAHCKSIEQRLEQVRATKCLHAGFAELGVDEQNVVYCTNDYGKPYLPDALNINFSISHTKSISIVAFCDKEIGIDCENNNRVLSSEILNRYFSKQEADAFSSSPVFLWVAKEAFVKYTGKGFAHGRKEIELPFFENELLLDGVWFKKLDIEGHTVVVCSNTPQEITVKNIL